MTDIPHFDLPFRMSGSSIAEVEQDSLDDISNCIVAAMATDVGFRNELPTFGTTELTFGQQPLNLRGFTDEVLLHEPRADLLMDQHPDKLRENIAHLLFKISEKGEGVLE